MEKNMNVRNAVIGIITLSLLAGCSVFDRKPVDYKGAAETPALEVPPDLTSPMIEQRFAIPAADGTQVTKYSDFTRERVVSSPASSVSAPVVEVSAGSNTKLLEVGGTRFILLNESFDRVWRKVGLALERSGIAVADVDRSKGIYFLKANPKDKKSADLQVLVHEASGTSDITVKEGNELKGKEATRILDLVFQNIEK
ncbi:MAG: outer membrane protein assembly factor BamC [Sideroxydans sp.]|nr:outer membrane protein assembly factor BamC [Sideroxydans sp.]